MDYSWWPENVFSQYLIIGSVMSIAIVFCSTLILTVFSFGDKIEFKEIRRKTIFGSIMIIVVIYLTSMVMALSSFIVNNFGLIWLIGILSAIFIVAITILIYNMKKRI